MTTDELARTIGVGCDYCGATDGLERYDPPVKRLLSNGFRCADASACNVRELARLPAEEEER